MHRRALLWCLAVLSVIAACDSDTVDESILPSGDTEIGKLRGGSVDTLCTWTRDEFAKAGGVSCDLGDPKAAPAYAGLVDFAGSSCGPATELETDCSLSVNDYEACIDALVADACSEEATNLCGGLGKCSTAQVELTLEPSCSGLLKCCKEIDDQTERERCKSVAAGESEVACGLELTAYVGWCPDANGASE